MASNISRTIPDTKKRLERDQDGEQQQLVQVEQHEENWCRFVVGAAPPCSGFDSLHHSAHTASNQH